MRYDDLFPKFPAFFDDFFTKDFENGGNNNVPAVNIKENENSIDLEVAVPGYKKDNFTVELNKDVLKIAANVENKQEEENENYTYRQFNFHSFERSFRLPENTVKADEIEAKYENGILYLHLPKVDEVKPIKKQIAIS